MRNGHFLTPDELFSGKVLPEMDTCHENAALLRESDDFPQVSIFAYILVYIYHLLT